MQLIAPNFMFNNGTKDVIDVYLTVFPNSKLVSEEFLPDGNHLASTFQLIGFEFLATLKNRSTIFGRNSLLAANLMPVDGSRICLESVGKSNLHGLAKR